MISLGNEKMIIVEKDWVAWSIEIDRGAPDYIILTKLLYNIIQKLEIMIERYIYFFNNDKLLN